MSDRAVLTIPRSPSLVYNSTQNSPNNPFNGSPTPILAATADFGGPANDRFPTTPQPNSIMSEKTRYSDEELQEFKEIILEKLKKAQRDYDLLKADVTNSDGNDVADTSPTFKVLEEGATTLSKEEAGRMAQRQMKFIQHLQAALVRIENKTYGICRETGQLIPKERLRAVPHATLSIEVKNKAR